MIKNDLRLTASTRRAIRQETTALDEVLVALTPLDFAERRRVLRWVCDYYTIDPVKLPVGS